MNRELYYAKPRHQLLVLRMIWVGLTFSMAIYLYIAADRAQLFASDIAFQSVAPDAMSLVFVMIGLFNVAFGAVLFQFMTQRDRLRARVRDDLKGTRIGVNYELYHGTFMKLYRHYFLPKLLQLIFTETAAVLGLVLVLYNGYFTPYSATLFAAATIGFLFAMPQSSQLLPVVDEFI